MLDLLMPDRKHFREKIDKNLNHGTTLQRLSSNQQMFEQLLPN